MCSLCYPVFVFTLAATLVSSVKVNGIHHSFRSCVVNIAFLNSHEYFSWACCLSCVVFHGVKRGWKLKLSALLYSIDKNNH